MKRTLEHYASLDDLDRVLGGLRSALEDRGIPDSKLWVAWSSEDDLSDFHEDLNELIAKKTSAGMFLLGVWDLTGQPIILRRSGIFDPKVAGIELKFLWKKDVFVERSARKYALSMASVPVACLSPEHVELLVRFRAMVMLADLSEADAVQWLITNFDSLVLLTGRCQWAEIRLEPAFKLCPGASLGIAFGGHDDFGGCYAVGFELEKASGNPVTVLNTEH